MEILLLNLDRSADRLQYFRNVNRHLIDVTRVSAVDGTLLDRDALVQNGVMDADLPYTPGAIGCALSHGRLWKQALSENRPLTIAEDDSLFSYFFQEQSRSMLRAIDPDWDFILWGYGLRQFLWVGTVPGAIVSEIRFADQESNIKLETFQCTHCPAVLMRMVHGYGYVCYSISPRGAKKLLDRCFPLRRETIKLKFSNMLQENEGLDCVANDIYADMKSYVSVAPLVVTEFRMPSTIR